MSKKEENQKDDNRSRQLNPEHDTHWKDRGEEKRPEDWKERSEQDDKSKNNDKK